jgi:hypothetical protein
MSSCDKRHLPVDRWESGAEAVLRGVYAGMIFSEKHS